MKTQNSLKFWAKCLPTSKETARQLNQSNDLKPQSNLCFVSKYLKSVFRKGMSRLLQPQKLTLYKEVFPPSALAAHTVCLD